MNLKTAVKLAKQNCILLSKCDKLWDNKDSAVKTLLGYYAKVRSNFWLALIPLACSIASTFILSERSALLIIHLVSSIIILLLVINVYDARTNPKTLSAFKFIKGISLLEKVVRAEFGEATKFPNGEYVNPWWNEEFIIKAAMVYLNGVAVDVRYWQRCAWNEEKAKKQKQKFVAELGLLQKLLKRLPGDQTIYFGDKNT